jgi:hypothetical protein
MPQITDSQLKTLIAEAFRCEVHDYAADYALVDSYLVRDGRPVAYCERKVRPDITSTTHPTAIIDEQKWMNVYDREIVTGLPAFVAYAWSDVWGWIRPTDRPLVTVELVTPSPESRSLNKGVRRPVVHIPIGAFTIGGRV